MLVAVKGLIDLRELRHLWRVSRFEFGVSMTAFGGVLVLGILKGVMLAAIVSMLLLIRRAARPHVAFLGRIPGYRGLSDMERNPDNEAVPGALVFRVEAALLYFNVEHVRDAVWAQLRSIGPAVRLVVCDLSTSPNVDLAGGRMLARLHEELQAAGIDLRLTAAHARVRDLLRAEGLEERTGYFGRRSSAIDVVEEFERADMPIPHSTRVNMSNTESKVTALLVAVGITLTLHVLHAVDVQSRVRQGVRLQGASHLGVASGRRRRRQDGADAGRRSGGDAPARRTGDRRCRDERARQARAAAGGRGGSRRTAKYYLLLTVGTSLRRSASFCQPRPCGGCRRSPRPRNRSKS